MGREPLILLDTQIVVWINQQQDRISRTALEAISNTRRNGKGLAIADITLWEIAMGVSKNRIELGSSLSAALGQVAEFYTVLPITPKIAELAMTLFKASHSDPANRLIAATALVHNIPLVTADGRILASGEVPTIW